MIRELQKKIIGKLFSKLARIKFKKMINPLEVEKFQKISDAEVLNIIKQPDCILIEVRCSNAFNGWTMGKNITGGHIGDAVNFPLAWIEIKGTRIK